MLLNGGTSHDPLPAARPAGFVLPADRSCQSPAPPALPAPTNNHIYGKIVARDAAKKTVTVFASGKTVLVALDPTLRIFKVADKRGHPTGKFDDLAIGAEISIHLTAASAGTEAPVADEIRVRKAAPTTPSA